MAKWAIPTLVIEDGQEYFLAKNACANPDMPPLFYFRAKDIKGRIVMSQKPGLAIRYLGSSKLREALVEYPELIAIKVPSDADQRWKRRKRK